MIMTCGRTHHSDWGSRLARALGSFNLAMPLFLMTLEPTDANVCSCNRSLMAERRVYFSKIETKSHSLATYKEQKVTDRH